MKLILFWAAALSAAAETIPYYDLSGPWRLRDGQTEREINLPSRMPTGRYRLEKTLRLDPGVSAPLALVVDSISGSYRVSVNGVRIGEAGQWGTPWIPVVIPRPFEIPPGALSPELTITIEVDRPSLPIAIRGLGGGQARPPILTSPRMATELVEARSRDRQVRQAPVSVSMFTGFLFACFIWLAGRNQPGRANLWLSGAFVANALFDLGEVLGDGAEGHAPDASETVDADFDSHEVIS